MERVWVVGGPGSGKTTTARLIAEGLGAPHIELDALWWDADWTPAGTDELRRRLADRLAITDRWVVDGNYLDDLSESLLPQVDTIVWLHMPRRVAVGRAVWRSIRRAISRSSLWNGNRESIGVLSPRSLASLWRRWPEYDNRIGGALRGADLDVVRLRSKADIAQWLAHLS